MQITAHGKTFPTIEDARSQIAYLTSQNELHGASDGRVTEINAVEAAIAAHTKQARETVVVDDEGGRWTVVKDEFESPCDHALCYLLHRRFFTGTERHCEDIEGPNGYLRSEYLTGWHMKTNHQWVILRDGERVGDAHDTKRAALAQATRKPTH